MPSRARRAFRLPAAAAFDRVFVSNEETNVVSILDGATGKIEGSSGPGARDQKLLRRIDRVLARRSKDIRKLLDEYHVPVVGAQ